MSDDIILKASEDFKVGESLYLNGDGTVGHSPIPITFEDLDRAIEIDLSASRGKPELAEAVDVMKWSKEQKVNISVNPTVYLPDRDLTRGTVELTTTFDIDDTEAWNLLMNVPTDEELLEAYLEGRRTGLIT